MSEQIKNFKIFDLYETEEVSVLDPGLRPVINLQPKLILKSSGRNAQKFGQLKVNLVERLINKLYVSGHRNKKHRIMIGTNTGKYSKNTKIVLDAFKIIYEKTKINPVQVLVKALENSAPRDETTVIEYGGARYLQAVDVSPLRRVNVALRNIVHGASDRAFNKKKNIVEGLVEEILLAYENKGDSSAVRKKNESEKQADSAR
ncbi:30S ribosomal protein S7 [Candidatus Pacearchaeota archaeon]|nr:30S ribosomal protein S7 [Candidatus Pacearchaeota archaeon]